MYLCSNTVKINLGMEVTRKIMRQKIDQKKKRLKEFFKIFMAMVFHEMELLNYQQEKNLKKAKGNLISCFLIKYLLYLHPKLFFQSCGSTFIRED